MAKAKRKADTVVDNTPDRPVKPVAANKAQSRIVDFFNVISATFLQQRGRGKEPVYETKPVILMESGLLDAPYAQTFKPVCGPDGKPVLNADGDVAEYTKVTAVGCQYFKSPQVNATLDVGESDPAFYFAMLRWAMDEVSHFRGRAPGKTATEMVNVRDLPGVDAPSSQVAPEVKQSPGATEEQRIAAAVKAALAASA